MSRKIIGVTVGTPISPKAMVEKIFDWTATKEETGGDTIVIPEQTISGGMWSNRQYDIQPGVPYEVHINGVRYTCVPYNYDGGIVLGNYTIASKNANVPHNNEPFYIYWAGGSATAGMFDKDGTLSYPITLKVTDGIIVEYNKMPEGYLPDCVVKSVNGVSPDVNGNVEIKGGITDTARALLITILRNAVYTSDQSAIITALETALASNASGGGGEEEPGVPEEPDEPEVTLSSISATYSGGDVPVGTAVANLTGLVVTAVYSDGSTKTVTGYTLSGTIAEGSNTITVSYGGKATTFVVVGVVEEEADSEELMSEANMVLADHVIYCNPVYSFYELKEKNGCNVYEIPVEAGTTYALTIVNANQYGTPYWAEVEMNKLNVNVTAISAEKITDFATVGSRITWTFDGNTARTTDVVTEKKDDGLWHRTVFITPAISGYWYTWNASAITDNNYYSVKKVVA